MKKDVGKQLLNLREENNWTQTQVAKKLSVSQRAYSHYENGTRQVPLEILVAIADLYQVSTDYLLGRG